MIYNKQHLKEQKNSSTTVMMCSFTGTRKLPPAPISCGTRTIPTFLNGFANYENQLDFNSEHGTDNGASHVCPCQSIWAYEFRRIQRNFFLLRTVKHTVFAWMSIKVQRLQRVCLLSKSVSELQQVARFRTDQGFQEASSFGFGSGSLVYVFDTRQLGHKLHLESTM